VSDVIHYAVWFVCVLIGSYLGNLALYHYVRLGEPTGFRHVRLAGAGLAYFSVDTR